MNLEKTRSFKHAPIALAALLLLGSSLSAAPLTSLGKDFKDIPATGNMDVSTYHVVQSGPYVPITQGPKNFIKLQAGSKVTSTFGCMSNNTFSAKVRVSWAHTEGEFVKPEIMVSATDLELRNIEEVAGVFTAEASLDDVLRPGRNFFHISSGGGMGGSRVLLLDIEFTADSPIFYIEGYPVGNSWGPDSPLLDKFDDIRSCIRSGKFEAGLLKYKSGYLYNLIATRRARKWYRKGLALATEIDENAKSPWVRQEATEIAQQIRFALINLDN